MSALNVSEADVQTLLEGFTVQGLQGLTLFTLNAFIVVVVLFHRLLRHEKEYLIVAGMASCDTLRGLAMLVTGLGRNIAIRFGGGENKTNKTALLGTHSFADHSHSHSCQLFMPVII